MCYYLREGPRGMGGNASAEKLRCMVDHAMLLSARSSGWAHIAAGLGRFHQFTSCSAKVFSRPYNDPTCNFVLGRVASWKIAYPCLTWARCRPGSPSPCILKSASTLNAKTQRNVRIFTTSMPKFYIQIYVGYPSPMISRYQATYTGAQKCQIRPNLPGFLSLPPPSFAT